MQPGISAPKLAEWQCAEINNPLKHEVVERENEAMLKPLTAVLQEPPEGRVWICYRCQAPLVRVRDYPVRTRAAECP